MISLALPARAGSEAFVKITGITGDSMDAKHKGEIDVLAWSWGVTQAGSSRALRGEAMPRAGVQEVTITKRLDSSSPTLFQAVATNRRISEVVLTMRKVGGKDQVEFVKIRLKDAVVSSVKIVSASTAEAAPTEEVTLSFATFEYAYTPQNAAGMAGAPVTAAGGSSTK